jgi:hypothetical protein
VRPTSKCHRPLQRAQLRDATARRGASAGSNSGPQDSGRDAPSIRQGTLGTAWTSRHHPPPPPAGWQPDTRHRTRRGRRCRRTTTNHSVTDELRPVRPSFISWASSRATCPCPSMVSSLDQIRAGTHRSAPAVCTFTSGTNVPANQAAGADTRPRDERRAHAAPRARVRGGVATLRQAFTAGAIDELTLDIVPVLLGCGERLLDDTGDRVSCPSGSSTHATQPISATASDAESPKRKLPVP